LKFHVEQVDKRLIAVFDDEPPPRKWLLASFLEQARPHVQRYLDEIERARSGSSEPTGYTGDEVDVEFYADRAVIEELWPSAGDDAEPERLELTLDEARQLLLDWQIALEQWRLRS
jgi:hypothetical protein